jgi:hypothetical protein
MQAHHEGEKPAGADPKDWSVRDVTHWLEGRGFNKDVCNKFASALSTVYEIF